MIEEWLFPLILGSKGNRKGSGQIQIGCEKLGEFVLHLGVELEGYVGAVLGDVDHAAEQPLLQPITLKFDHMTEGGRDRRLEPRPFRRDIADRTHPRPAAKTQLCGDPAGQTTMPPLFRRVFRVPRHTVNQVKR